jgi:hydroxymethylpyrimidine/phosphomethylpyrimidine kinase
MVAKRQHPTRFSVLTIAGSDSGGASGIQADLKTFTALGVHGLSVITAVTSQNLQAVQAIHRVPVRHIRSQLRALLDDFDIKAVKIGMLGSAAAIDAVGLALEDSKIRHIVLDPVLVSTSGTALLPPRAIAWLRDVLFPITEILTPNLPEAEMLLGRSLADADDRRDAAFDLLTLGPQSVLLKGGHAKGGKVYDYFVDANRTKRGAPSLQTFTNPRLPIQARGTGCTLASAIAAGLARGLTREAGVAAAERYLQRCMRRAYRPGRGRLYILG